MIMMSLYFACPCASNSRSIYPGSHFLSGHLSPLLTIYPFHESRSLFTYFCASIFLQTSFPIPCISKMLRRFFMVVLFRIKTAICSRRRSCSVWLSFSTSSNIFLCLVDCICFLYIKYYLGCFFSNGFRNIFS